VVECNSVDLRNLAAKPLCLGSDKPPVRPLGLDHNHQLRPRPGRQDQTGQTLLNPIMAILHRHSPLELPILVQKHPNVLLLGTIETDHPDP